MIDGLFVIIASIATSQTVTIPIAQKNVWLYELRLNGFILFRNFLPLDLIEAMREQFHPLYSGEMARVTAGDTSSLRGRNRMSFDIAYYVETPFSA